LSDDGVDGLDARPLLRAGGSNVAHDVGYAPHGVQYLRRVWDNQTPRRR
jgi:hypothetical protein